jgi:hypothetical protein
MSIEFIKYQLNLDVPFLFGQISLKCFKSSDGRAFSIGMQYLTRNFQFSISMVVVGTPKYRPNCMQPIDQSLLLRLASDKSLDGFQLVCTACLKSARVVENVSTVVRECEFILDVMKATLSTGSS